ncbi:MAG TPA: Clp protease N-terminal domain-containing protein [Acidimicrobiia bacterium]|nr:Clp protease N-terminal domain-containing protein [Acidimicrobiia bacterium]
MAPPPTLQDLIELAERDAETSAPLDQLTAAATTVAHLERVGDAVLSHFVDRARVSGHSWSEISGALGVTKQAAHKRFSFPAPAAPALERFTPRARRVLEHAETTAQALRHNYIGTEHLLLALFDEPEGIGAKVLVELGADREAVAREVLQRTTRGTAATTATVPMTPRATAVLAAAVGQALELGHNYVGTEHLLLGLFSDTEGMAAQVLATLGVDRQQVRGRIIEMLAGFRAP